MPGGCNFGTRPIDEHLKGFRKLGANCTDEDGKININASKLCQNQKITLDKISVGATINMVLASVLIDGCTIIKNCAIEPHVDDLIYFLNKCGAHITRSGRTIYINGVSTLHGTSYCIFPDMIESLTYACFVGASAGSIILNSVKLEHLQFSLSVLKSMGMEIRECENRVWISKKKELNGVHVVTAPYPFFPTDLHPQLSSLLCFTKDGGSIRDDIFPTRFAYVDELKRMGALIERNRNIAIVKPSILYGTKIDATDLRAGASLITASLGALGVSEISNVNYIVRGYENLVDKISSIGGKIKIVNN
jgi:UDP-N-acetylglucosamine 1-carboxyvinyltransferase